MKKISFGDKIFFDNRSYIEKCMSVEDANIRKRLGHRPVSFFVSKSIYNLPLPDFKFSLGNMFLSVKYKYIFILIGLRDAKEQLKRIALVNIESGTEFYYLSMDNKNLESIITKNINVKMVSICAMQSQLFYLADNITKLLNCGIYKTKQIKYGKTIMETSK